MSRIAIVQRPPIFLNRAETTRAAAASILEAAQAGAQLIVFTTNSGSCMQTSTSTASVPRSAASIRWVTIRGRTSFSCT